MYVMRPDNDTCLLRPPCLPLTLCQLSIPNLKEIFKKVLQYTCYWTVQQVISKNGNTYSRYFWLEMRLLCTYSCQFHECIGYLYLLNSCLSSHIIPQIVDNKKANLKTIAQRPLNPTLNVYCLCLMSHWLCAYS